MTGRQEYDRMKDRQRTLGKYMINGIRTVFKIWKITNMAYSELVNIKAGQNFVFNEDTRHGKR
jgi:hypothetical protein